MFEEQQNLVCKCAVGQEEQQGQKPEESVTRLSSALAYLAVPSVTVHGPFKMEEVTPLFLDPGSGA